MASQFYNRYIPPSGDAQDSHASPPPLKKRKVSAVNPRKRQTVCEDEGLKDATLNGGQISTSRGHEDANGRIQTENIVVAHASTEEQHSTDYQRRQKERKTKKKEKLGKGSHESEALYISNNHQDSSVIDEDPKHRGIRLKYASAAKLAAQEAEAHPVTANAGTLTQDEHMPIDSHGLEPLPQPSPVDELPRVSAFSALPGWLQKPTIVSTTDTIPFESLSMSPNIGTALKQKGFTEAFAIQAGVLPLLLPGPRQYSGDICISAATGSGKTLAYALPMVQSLQGRPVTRLRGLVVVPTRELVTQARETIEMCSGGAGVKVGTAVGSKSSKEEQDLLIEKGQRHDPDAYRVEQEKVVDEDEELMNWDFDETLGSKDDFYCFYNHVVEFTSKIDILICTPGRLVDHIQNTKGFTLEHVQWLVIDEADRLLDESFQQWVDVVVPGLEYVPPLDPRYEQLSETFHFLRRREVQKVILSATMTKDVSKLAALKLNYPKLVVLENQKEPGEFELQKEPMGSEERLELPAALHETAIPIAHAEDKPLHLVQILQGSFDMPNGASKPSLNRDDADRDFIDTSSESDTSSDDSESSADSNPGSVPSRQSNKKVLAPIKSSSDNGNHGTLIFTNNNESALRLARLLSILRPDWASLISTLTKSSTSSSGRKALTAFRKRRTSILIASDRASRGLDIQTLASVINYDMPRDISSYIHRVGRTARAGKDGQAMTLVAHHEARWFWNEIGKSDRIVRGPGRKIVRVEWKLEVDKDQRRMYEDALHLLGEEARGEGRKA